MVCRCCNKDGPCFDSGDCAPGYKCCVDEEGNGLCRIEPYNWSVSLPSPVYEGTDVRVDVSHAGGCDGEQYYAYFVPYSQFGADPAEPEDLQWSGVLRYTQLAPSGDFGYGNFNITIKSDSLVEPDEYFQVKIYRSNSLFSELLAESGLCRIIGATWQVVPSVGNSVNEGSSKSFLVTTTNVPEGTEFEWSISHVTTTNQDFTGTNDLPAVNTPRGYGVIDAYGNATFSIPVVYLDAFTEGSEVFRVSIASGGAVVATSVNVTINDTSPNPPGLLQCGTTSVSGGAGTSIQYYDVGIGAGTVQVRYNAFNVPDRFTFYAGGGNGVLGGTNGYVSGEATISFFKPYGIKTIRGVVEGPEGTAWCYTLMCPNDSTPPPSCN